MENAGALAARLIARDYQPSPVSILAGAGNNGGDGFVVARHLARRGFQPVVYALGDPAALRGEAAYAASLWTGAVIPLTKTALIAPLIIDALFGSGLTRPLEGLAAQLAEASVQKDDGQDIVALDMPSGVAGDSGEVLGAAFRARLTIAFAAMRAGHFLLPGRDYCGRVECVDIGIPSSVIAGLSPSCFHNTPDLWRASLPRLAAASHKYQRGHVLVTGGGLARAGASRMAALAALRTGAGLVSLAAPPDALAAHSARGEALMLEAIATPDALTVSLADTRKNTVLVGPGTGEQAAALARTALASSAAVVLDADALTSFTGQTKDLTAAIAARAAPVVLTPHEGEYERLFAYKGSKLERARAAAEASGAHIVLKGADTVIAAPDGRAAITSNAPPFLASAGTGDVLAGMIAGLMAQSMPVWEAACAAVWLHGEAAREAGLGLIAAALPDILPPVMKRVWTA